MNDLELAQARRDQAVIDKAIDDFINDRISKVHLAAPISAHAKVKLRGILKKYAKEAHPFRACVKDNMARFGPGRTEAVCATLKDTIKGNKSWRGKTEGKGSTSLSEADHLVVDGEVLLALDAISEIDLAELFLEVRAMDEHGTKEGVALLSVSGAAELSRWGDGVALSERS